MHLCNLGTVEPPGSELSPIDWGFEYHSDGRGVRDESRRAAGVLVLSMDMNI